MEEWESAVSKFHSNSCECLLCLRNIDKMKDDGLVVSEHITMCDSEKQGIADLPCGASDSHSDRFFGFGLNKYVRTKEANADLAKKFISTILIISWPVLRS